MERGEEDQRQLARLCVRSQDPALAHRLQSASNQQQLLPALSERGAGLIALSPQKPDGSLSAQEKHELSFPALSDPGNVLAAALGAVMPDPGDEVISAQRTLGLDLPEVNADGTTTLPFPTVAIAGADKVLRWIDVTPNFTARTEVAEILAGYDATA